MRENCSVIVCSYDYQCSENQNIFWIGPHSCTYVIAIKENNKNLCSFVRFPRYRRQQRQMETKHHGHVTNQFRQILLSICLLVLRSKPCHCQMLFGREGLKDETCLGLIDRSWKWTLWNDLLANLTSRERTNYNRQMLKGKSTPIVSIISPHDLSVISTCCCTAKD